MRSSGLRPGPESLTATYINMRCDELPWPLAFLTVPPLGPTGGIHGPSGGGAQYDTSIVT